MGNLKPIYMTTVTYQHECKLNYELTGMRNIDVYIVSIELSICINGEFGAIQD